MWSELFEEFLRINFFRLKKQNVSIAFAIDSNLYNSVWQIKGGNLISCDVNLFTVIRLGFIKHFIK